MVLTEDAAVPELRIGIANGVVRLSWPATALQVGLQQNPGLDPKGWVPVASPPKMIGSFNTVYLAPSGSMFFRLVPP